MKSRPCSSHSLSRFFFMAILLVGGATSALAHAVLVESTPTLNATVSGPDVAITLKFNVRIDAARSRLQLVLPDGTSRALPITAGSALNVMLARASALTPGKCKLIWQVLASDGHITRGEIAFSVK
jgi:copper resistance protein C